MADHGAKTKVHKLKLDNAVDMSTHLEEVISTYARQNSLYLRSGSPPADQKGSENSTFKEAASDSVKGDPPLSSSSMLPPSSDNQSSTPSVASTSSHSLPAAAVKDTTQVNGHASPAPTVVKKRRKKTYRCKHCSYTDITQYRIEVHSVEHTGQKPYRCDLCNFGAYSKFLVQRHKRGVHTEKPAPGILCIICEQEKPSKNSFIDHMVKKHSATERESEYRCVVKGCNYLSRSYQYMRNHLLMQHVDLEKMKKHDLKRSYFADCSRYQCHLCDFTCNRKSTLPVHFQYKHSEILGGTPLQEGSMESALNGDNAPDEEVDIE